MYLEEYQFYIVQRWMNTLQEWDLHLRSNTSNYKKCSLEWENFHAPLLNIDSSLERLDKEVFVDGPADGGSVVDPTRGLASNSLHGPEAAWDRRKVARMC